MVRMLEHVLGVVLVLWSAGLWEVGLARPLVRPLAGVLVQEKGAGSGSEWGITRAAKTVLGLGELWAS